MQAHAPETRSFATHLECSYTGERLEADRLHNLSAAGKPLLVRYDLEGAAEALTREALATARADPVALPRTAARAPAGEHRQPRRGDDAARARAARRRGPVCEGRRPGLPTGSFKARGLVMAVSMAKELGVRRIAMPTNGNAGAALAAYCRRAGMEAYVFCPADTPEVNVREIALQGAEVWRGERLYRRLRQARRRRPRGDGLVRLLDPERALPDRGQEDDGPGARPSSSAGPCPTRSFYPTGRRHRIDRHVEGLCRDGGRRPDRTGAPADDRGAGGRLPAHRARVRARRAPCGTLGRRGDHRHGHPRAGGAGRLPDPRCGARGAAAMPWRCPTARSSRPRAEMAREEGLLLCPEGAATYAAWKRAMAEGRLASGARSVLFNCATALKYPMPAMERRLDRTKPIDWSSLHV